MLNILFNMNKIWKQFIEMNPEPNKEKIILQLFKMRRQFGI